VKGQWVRESTFGGKLVENNDQGIARDLMAAAMLRVEAAGYPIVLSVHDELVSEIPEGFGSVSEYEDLMSEVPAWAEGIPVSAEGWRGKRYRKG
jgi:DNA polymerase